MNKFLAIVLLANIAMSSAVYLKSTTSYRQATFAQLNEIKDSEFGERILETIALQLKNKSPLSDVAVMLKDIRTNLALQQQESESVHVSQEMDCKDTIEEKQKEIEGCQVHADDAQEQIGELKSEIKALGVKVSQMGNQLEILNNRQAQLAMARQIDHEAFLKRQEQGPSVLSALDLIVEKLKTITPTSMDGAFAELAKIGKTNPIAALLQVASTFSAETLDNVIEKMITLKEEISASLESDVAEEAEAEEQFKQINGEIDNTRKQVTNAKKEAETTKGQKESSLALQEKRMAENTQCVMDAQTKKQAKLEQCAMWNEKYETDKVNRAAEISIIEQVEQIVATKLDTMKDYMEEQE